jgi:hypothetical protein
LNSVFLPRIARFCRVSVVRILLRVRQLTAIVRAGRYPWLHGYDAIFVKPQKLNREIKTEALQYAGGGGLETAEGQKYLCPG